MSNKLTKSELVERIERLKSGRYNEDEMKALFREIGESVPCPRAMIQGLIFHAKDNPNATEIVERMLAYRSIKL